MKTMAVSLKAFLRLEVVVILQLLPAKFGKMFEIARPNLCDAVIKKNFCPEVFTNFIGHGFRTVTPLPKAGSENMLQNVSQLLANNGDLEERKRMLAAILRGSAVVWQHINMQGEYDFIKHAANQSIFDFNRILALKIGCLIYCRPAL